MRFNISILVLSSLLALCGCREDSPVNNDGTESGDKFLGLKSVAIGEISKPSDNGLKTIALTFKGDEGTELEMVAGGLYNYLDPGYYRLVPSVTERFDAVFELTFGGKPVTLDEGTAYVARENNSYEIFFEFKSGETVYSGELKKSIAFKTEYHKTLSSGGDGTVKKDQYVSSSYLGKSIPYTIYLPKGYDGTKKYPILYLLHGAMDYGQGHNKWYLDYNASNAWNSGAAVPAYASEYADNGGPEMIIVTPECCDDCFYCDTYKSGHRYMSFFFEEFVPHIERVYSVRSERNSRAVAGLSMGGYGSLYYGLLHPEMFCQVYACSAAVGMGAAAPDLYSMVTAAVKGETIDELPGITLEMGSSDGTVPPSTNAQFIKFLKDNKVPCEYITRGGGHDWTFWNGCAPKIIAKVGAIFAHNE